MKTLLFILVLSIPSVSFAQWPNPENARLTNTINGFMNAFGGGGFPAYVPMPDDYSYGGSYNPYQQQLQNDLTRVEVFFQKRQTNRYYTLLEEAQKNEIKSLRKSGDLTIDEVNRIFNRGRY